MCGTEVTVIPAVRTNLFCDIFAHGITGVTRVAYKRKENARVKSAVRWPLIGFVEAVRDYAPIKSYGSVRRRTSKGSCHPKLLDKPSSHRNDSNKNLRFAVKHPAIEG